MPKVAHPTPDIVMCMAFKQIVKVSGLNITSPNQ